MVEKELEIDVTAVGRKALQERQPEEDLEEALLRACKQVYGESSLMAFQAIQSGLRATAEHNQVDLETALQQMMTGQSSISVVTKTETITTQKVLGSGDELSPEIQAMVEKALASGKSQEMVLTKTFGGEAQGRSSIVRSRRAEGVRQCANCGSKFSSVLSSCPQCRSPLQRSFWSRLFGKK
ncbi:MAG: hypothetical protein HY695_26180 [Deltaproteobacteria bacterium]|nr:hypothetical protein [Deltaproteobacteria bacterium]